MNLTKWLAMDLQEKMLISEYGLSEIRPDTLCTPMPTKAEIGGQAP